MSMYDKNHYNKKKKRNTKNKMLKVDTNLEMICFPSYPMLQKEKTRPVQTTLNTFLQGHKAL